MLTIGDTSANFDLVAVVGADAPLEVVDYDEADHPLGVNDEPRAQYPGVLVAAEAFAALDIGASDGPIEAVS